MTSIEEFNDVSWGSHLEAAESIVQEADTKICSSQEKGWSSKDVLERHPDRMTMEQLRALLLPSTVTKQFQVHASVSTTTDSTNKVKAVTPSEDSSSRSYLDRAADEARSWASWMWNMINPWNDSEAAENHEPSLAIERRNSDGTINPFATPCRALTAEERKRILAATKEMNVLLNRIRDLLGDDQFELVMHLVLQEAVRAKKEAGDITQTELIHGYEKRKKLNSQRLQESETLIKDARRSQWWGQFEEVATTLGLTLSAAGAMGNGGWGVVALCYTMGTAYNRWKDCVVEKNVAKGGAWLGSLLFGWNPKKTENELLPTLKIGSGLINMLITLSFAQSHWLGTVMEGAMTLVSTSVKVKADRAQGRLYKLDKDLEENQDGISGKVKGLGSNVQRQFELHKQLGEVNSKQAENAQLTIRGG